MSFRYIGSKSRIVEQIKSHIGPNTGGIFVDAFCGTGVVAEAAAKLGWSIRINDSMISAVISAGARLISIQEAQFLKLGGYEKAIEILNGLPPTEGFIYRSYSPASIETCGFERRYFTASNAGHIDSARRLIKDWAESGMISPIEERLLVADLFGALNRVANIAGTFGCFLSKWTPQASQLLTLRPRDLKANITNVVASVGDVFDIQTDFNDVVYLDPPYTKRQYASYYHILETVALGDEPDVIGVSGLRPWRDRASEFCYKSRALDTLTRLVGEINSHRILLSYSSEGHVSLEELKPALCNTGETIIHPVGVIGRYRPNKVASDSGAQVREYLVVISRELEQRKISSEPASVLEETL